jgi:Fe(3+) dicitrate transport protein
MPSPRAAIAFGVDVERSVSAELGARYEGRDGAFRLECAGFFTYFWDLVALDSQGGAGTDIPDNVGEVLAAGLELAAAVDLGEALDLGVGLPLHVAATYTHARLRSDVQSPDPESIFSGGEEGNELPYVPRYQLSAGAGIDIGRLGLRLSLSYVPETFTTASNVSDQRNALGQPDARFGETDAYVLLDLTGRLELFDGGRLVFGAHNLLDQSYVTSRHPEGPRPGLPLFGFVGFEWGL